jgi:hypothetical protein
VFDNIAANLPSSLILVSLMMEGIRSYETPVLTTATLRNVPKEDVRHCNVCEDLKSQILHGVTNCIHFFSLSHSLLRIAI